MKETQTLKVLIKMLNSVQIYLLKIQIERERNTSSLQRLTAYMIPIFLSIFNSCYTFQAKIFQNTKLSIIYRIFLYLTPDQLSLSMNLPNWFIILTYIIILLPVILILLQIYQIKRFSQPSNWVTFLINMLFPLIFRLLILPMISILLWSIKSNFFPDLSLSDNKNSQLGGYSIIFLILIILETLFFLLYFSVNSYQNRKKHIFSCSNLIGDVSLITNCYLMAIINIVFEEKEVWQNFIRVVLHGYIIHTLVMKQPYYNFNTNVMFGVSFSFSFIVSFGFLIAYNVNSSTIVVFLMIFFSPAALYLVVVFTRNQRVQIIFKAKKEIEFEWQIDLINIYFIEEFEKNKVGKNSAELEELINKTCNDLEKFYEEKVKVHAQSLVVSLSLFLIYVDRPERAYYNIFFHSLKDSNYFCAIQMKKIELIVSEFRILEHFYSDYFLLTSKCKKNDLKVCRTLLRLCTELHKNYPNLSKIKQKLTNLMTVFEKCLKIYSNLMKDYQSQENLELYGSFLINILSDTKGNKYLTLAKNMSSEQYNDSKVFWLLDKDTGYCVFNVNSKDFGRIIEFNQQFLDILHINKETISENVLDLIYGPFQKVAQDLLFHKLNRMRDFEVLRDCFRCFVDYEDFFIDIDLYLIPINWKNEKCLLLTIRPLSEILIVIEKDLKILNVSRNFVNKVLGNHNKTTIPFMLNKKITYFLPDFLKKYQENSSFSFEIYGTASKMDIVSKTFKYKHSEYIFLNISNLSKAIFRQNSLMETIKRKHSLMIIQISDNQHLSKSKIAEKASNLSMKDSTIESKKYDYEPESFSLSKRAKKDNNEILTVFTKRKTWIKLILLFIYICSIISMAGALVCVVFYVKSFRESVIIGKYSDILGTIQDITIETRMLNLINLGFMQSSFSPVFKSYLNSSTTDLQSLIEEIDSNPLISNSKFYSKKSIDLVTWFNQTLVHKSTSLEDAIRQYISKSQSFYSSPYWNNDDFLFLYTNGHGSLIQRFIEDLHLVSYEFYTSKLKAEQYLILIIVLPQVFLGLLMVLLLFPQLRKVGKSYKDILREITSLKNEKLMKISEIVIKRMKIYHHEVRDVKNSERNRKPEIKKKWKFSALLFISVLAGYCVVVNICITIPASGLNEKLKIYTGEGLMTINYYIMFSYFWVMEHYLLDLGNLSYNEILPYYMLKGDMSSKVYSADDKIRSYLKDFRVHMHNPDSQTYLLSSTCSTSCQSSNLGLSSEISDLLLIQERVLQLKQISNVNSTLGHYQKATQIKSDINSFRKICRDYTEEVLINWNFLALGISINLLFGIFLVIAYHINLRSSLKSVVMFVTFRIFYKGSAKPNPSL